MEKQMADEPLRILIIGAHPDDCDISAGGMAAIWRQAGHIVRFVSTTNGESGHHEMSAADLIAARRSEADAVAERLGIQYDILKHRDGRLMPTLEARFELIGMIRQFNPDLVLTHRPNDYHPDHRYTSLLVCDAAYMVTVPPVVPEVPALRDNPVIGYMSDGFQRPYPFTPDLVVDVEPVIETVVDLLDCHRSQFYEWLAYNHRYDHLLPDDDAGRREFLGQWFRERIAPLADQHRQKLIETYGEDRGSKVRYIEGIEISEYGSPLTADLRTRLFPDQA